MLGLLKVTVLSGVVLSQVSCGGVDQTAKSLSDKDSETLMLVVMGGNNSCGDQQQIGFKSPFKMDLFAPFKKLKDLLSERDEPNEFIISCFIDENTLAYSSSRSNNQVEEGSIEEFSSYLESGVDDNSAVSIAGHSYGGWLTLKAAAEYSEIFRFKNIFAIDPISRKECTFSSPRNCTSAPKDITSEQYALINENSQNFFNYYQTSTFYLHSSPIKEADKNLRVSASHTSIDTSSKVWQDIEQTILN